MFHTGREGFFIYNTIQGVLSMKKAHKFIGIALIAAIFFSALSLTGCPTPDGSGGGNKENPDIQAVGDSLNSKPPNNKNNPYVIALAINSTSDIIALGNMLNSAPDKYVRLDLSGSTITTIPNSAFADCASLTGVTIPNSVTNIEGSAFYNCTNLASITIPNSVTSIGDSAFNSCTSLASVTIGNRVASIGSGTFVNCTNLTSITIPNSVTSIGMEAFAGCTSLTRVTFQGTIASANFSSSTPFPGDLRDKYLAGGIGTYTRPNTTSSTWTKTS
jgi:predicted small secreted protein